MEIRRKADEFNNIHVKVMASNRNPLTPLASLSFLYGKKNTKAIILTISFLLAILNYGLSIQIIKHDVMHSVDQFDDKKSWEDWL